MVLELPGIKSYVWFDNAVFIPPPPHSCYTGNFHMIYKGDY